MWLFGRKPKAQTPELPPGLGAIGEAPAPTGPQLIRRVEITVEREWTSTVVRRRTGEGAAGSEAPKLALDGWHPGPVERSTEDK